ncbi:hypothetical protein LBMAG42_48660 [Deltaproteobacteria bacterium]|nr:hypothetical protein LBMAG42_48660 [Deltaproteobacteria bacterium]
MLLLLVTLALAEANPEVAPTEVVLDDGQILRGMIERQEDGSIVVTLGSGTMLRFPSAAIREVRPATPPPPPVVCPEPTAVATTPPPAGGDLPLPTDHPGEPRTAEGWPRDPNRNRYLYAPSGFTLGAGHGYVSQKEILLTEVAYGITDFWDVQAGTSLITLVIPDGQFGVLGTKLAAPVTPLLRLGGGTQVLFATDMILAAVFGTVTFGTEDKHLSINAGTTFFGHEDFVEPADGGIVIISGNYRLGPRTALIMENWLFIGQGFTPTGDDLWLVPTAGVRLFGPNFATDLGLVPIFIDDSSVPVIPIPWVGFTYNFAMPYAK